MPKTFEPEDMPGCPCEDCQDERDFGEWENELDG